MPTPAELLEACLRVLNNPHITTEEKPAWVAWMAKNMHRLDTGLARLQLRVEERTKASVDGWGRRERFNRRYHAEDKDLVSEPSDFNAYDYPSNATTR